MAATKPRPTAASSAGHRATQAREERILDAAADLLLRRGYRHSTIDDVAARAGVGKGTVYLHWPNRQRLFQTVLAREVQAAIADLVDVIRSDPEAWRPHGLAYAYFLAIRRRPLLAAVCLSDSEVLGDLTLAEDDDESAGHALLSTAYFARLAQDGLLAADLTPATAGYAFAAILEGFLRAEGQREPALSDEPARAALLSHVVGNALERDHDLSAEQDATLRADVIALLAGRLDPADGH